MVWGRCLVVYFTPCMFSRLPPAHASARLHITHFSVIALSKLSHEACEVNYRIAQGGGSLASLGDPMAHKSRYELAMWPDSTDEDPRRFDHAVSAGYPKSPSRYVVYVCVCT